MKGELLMRESHCEQDSAAQAINAVTRKHDTGRFIVMVDAMQCYYGGICTLTNFCERVTLPTKEYGLPSSPLQQKESYTENQRISPNQRFQ